MTLKNIRLIFLREMRDQLRDRRTLFMVAVLPILLYPLLGMSMFQVAQFMQQQPTRVLVAGASHLDDLPPLFEGSRFASSLFKSGKVELVELIFAGQRTPGEDFSSITPETEAQIAVQSGNFDAALYFPTDFVSRLDAFREAVRTRAENRSVQSESPESAVPLEVPKPKIIYNTANDRSQLAHARLSAILDRWKDNIGDENLLASGVSTRTAHPFSLESTDVSIDNGHRGAAAWSKILPVLLLLWTLTGAFYPAVDLCAGEKERGTLETLLTSPAQRSEIVVGKLLTIMLFSIATAVLNLASVGVTGWVVLTHMEGFSLPPLTAIIALGVALVPIAALFSSLCLALASFARSTKEGQYYLMPVLLVVMPLVVLPMSPGVDLNFGNSLIPVTGVVLLLRSVLEGDYLRAMQFSPTVIAITMVSCLVSIRWAIDQFNSETVLFRESERLNLGLWLRHLYRDRQATPGVSAAVFCGVMILVIRFFLSFSLSPGGGFGGFVRATVTMQVMFIAVPALLMTFFLARSPRQTLLLKWPSVWALPAAALLAIALHPAANVLQSTVTQLYPISDSIRPAMLVLQEMLQSASVWSLILVIAVLPAICEELAFRGFILSGFRHVGHKWRAIAYSAIFFSLAHGILQQSLIAGLVGVVIGYLAVQSGSILPGIVFHLIHNSLVVVNSRVTSEMFSDSSPLRLLFDPGEGGGCTFHWSTVVACSLLALLPLAWFAKQPYTRSSEETLQDVILQAEKSDASLAPA